MELQNISGRKVAESDQPLVERARKAVQSINRTFDKKGNIASAVVWPGDGEKPTRLDFMAHVPGEIGQAFLGPDAPLAENLFDGEKFTSEFSAQIEESFDAFQEHWNKSVPA